MPLSNHQYDQIMRKYEILRNNREDLIRSRRKEVYANIPRFAEIDDEIATASVGLFRDNAGKQTNPNVFSELHNKIQTLTQEKLDLLEKNGYGSDYLNPPYRCQDCKDTGYIEHEPCHCFVQRSLDLLYSQEDVRRKFKTENFSNFSLDYYDDNYYGGNRESSKANAKKAYDDAQKFVRDFETKRGNLLLYGDTGVGKTYLSNCIGKAILDQGHSVIYLTAFQLFEIFEQNTFKKKDTPGNIEDSYRNIFECDLLIIDDLGTEFSNSFTVSQLFQCINERLLKNRSTVISTNLTLEGLKKTYSERIFSRFIENYTLIKLFGRDIRIQKGLQNI